MTHLFRSKSCGFVGLTEFNTPPPSSVFNLKGDYGDEEDDNDGEYSECRSYDTCYPISTSFTSPAAKAAAAIDKQQADAKSQDRSERHNQHMFTILDFFMAALRKSLIPCSVERQNVSSMDISWPTNVQHVSHVTFDRFNGFLDLPTEFQTGIPRKAPSARASVFGVSAKSMPCSVDDRGNSVPTILLMMQRRLYSGGGLKAEGIFRINAGNNQEEFVRSQLNTGVVPHGIDVYCLSCLIKLSSQQSLPKSSKAWFRELPAGVLDSLTPQQVMHCNTEDDCSKLLKLLPPTEAALLDWAINLMADVVQHEEFNKMNARNIAMVFAPNMTKMADPLIALIHAVQAMNFLKTMILKVIRERKELVSKKSELSSTLDSTPIKNDPGNLSVNMEVPSKPSSEAHTKNNSDKLSTSKLNEEEWKIDEKLWCTEIEGNDERELSDEGAVGCRGRCDSTEHRLSLRKGVLKLSRHPMFQLTKSTKKTRNHSSCS